MATADGFETEDLYFGVGSLSFYNSSFLWHSQSAEIIKHFQLHCAAIQQMLFIDLRVT
jgi:hypothetical protein